MYILFAVLAVAVALGVAAYLYYQNHKKNGVHNVVIGWVAGEQKTKLPGLCRYSIEYTIKGRPHSAVTGLKKQGTLRVGSKAMYCVTRFSIGDTRLCIAEPQAAAQK